MELWKVMSAAVLLMLAPRGLVLFGVVAAAALLGAMIAFQEKLLYHPSVPGADGTTMKTPAEASEGEPRARRLTPSFGTRHPGT